MSSVLKARLSRFGYRGLARQTDFLPASFMKGQHSNHTMPGLKPVANLCQSAGDTGSGALQFSKVPQLHSFNSSWTLILIYSDESNKSHTVSTQTIA